MGIALSSMCAAPILRWGKQAMADCEAHKVTPELTEIIEAIIISTGYVSNFVQVDYTTGMAHAMYNGFTILPSTEEYHHLHGEVVSYGILVMLTADKQYAANAPALRKPPYQACAAPNQQRFRREVRCPLPAAEQPERRTARQQRPLAHAHRQDVVHHSQRSKKPQKFKGYDAHNPSSCLSRTRSIFPFIVCGNCGRW